DQCSRIGRGLLKAEILAGSGFRAGDADRAVDDEMAELMSDNVEVERVGRHHAVIAVMRPHLHEAVAHLRVVQAWQQNDFQPAETARKMQWDRAAEIPLPNVEQEACCSKDMLRRELGCADWNAIERAVRTPLRGRADRPPPRREVQIRRAVRSDIDAVGIAL